jgi:hypothetical protein
LIYLESTLKNDSFAQVFDLALQRRVCFLRFEEFLNLADDLILKPDSFSDE